MNLYLSSFLSIVRVNNQVNILVAKFGFEVMPSVTNSVFKKLVKNDFILPWKLLFYSYIEISMKMEFSSKDL